MKGKLIRQFASKTNCSSSNENANDVKYIGCFRLEPIFTMLYGPRQWFPTGVSRHTRVP